MKKFFLAAFAVVLGFMACKKDEAEPQLSNLEILQAHKWKYSVRNYSYNSQIVENLMTDENCESDDVFKFEENFSVLYYPGEKKCVPGDEEYYTETYSLNDAQDSLFLPGWVGLKIESISLEKMVWTGIVEKEGIDLTITTELVEEK